MGDKSNDLIRQRALRAARAVTMGAALVAAGCSSDTDQPPSEGWGIGEHDDASGDVSADVADSADVIAEVGPTCSESFDRVCPEGCEASNDADCCEQSGDCLWHEGETGGCACAVPGPFVPPSMVV
jgi:hypothetical protein